MKCLAPYFIDLKLINDKVEKSCDKVGKSYGIQTKMLRIHLRLGRIF